MLTPHLVAFTVLAELAPAAIAESAASSTRAKRGAALLEAERIDALEEGDAAARGTHFKNSLRPQKLSSVLSA